MGTLFQKSSALLLLTSLATYGAPPPPVAKPVRAPTAKGKHAKTPGKLPTPGMPGDPRAGKLPTGEVPGTNGNAPGNGKFLPPRPVALPGQESSNRSGTPAPGEVNAAPSSLTGCKLPVEAFLKVPALSQVRLGPDGYTYFLANSTGLMQLYRVNSPGVWPQLVVELKDGIRRYELDPTAKRVVLSTDVGGDEQFDLYIVPVTGAESQVPKPLWVSREKRIESFRWLDDNRLVATANVRNGVDMDLYEVPLDGNAPKLLAPLVGMNEVSDVSPDHRYLALERYRSALSSQVLLWDFTTRKITEFAGEATDDPARASRNVEPRFAASSQSLTWLSDQDGQFQQLYQQALSPAGKLTQVTRENGDVEWARWSRERKTMLMAVNIEGGTQLRALRADKKGALQTVGAPQFGDGVVTSADADESETLSVTAIASSFSEPPRLIRWKNGKRVYFSVGEELPDECRTPVTRVRYGSFDGLSIPAFVATPRLAKGDGKSPLPFLVYVHGGPEAQFRPEYSRSLAYVASMGIGVLAPNIRGSTGYGKDFTRRDDYKLRMDSVKDVIAGAQWLLKNGRAQAANLGIYGGSYGGFLVLRSIEVEPNLFAAASEAVGISDFVSFLKGTKSYRRELREREYGPLSDELFLRSISPMTYVDRIRTPLLIFHGARDPRVPVDESQRIAGQLRGMNRSVELKIFNDAGHGSHRVDQQIDQTRMLGAFLERWLLQSSSGRQK